MARQFLLVSVAIFVLSSAIDAQAGGWPRLFLPLDGVTAGNAEDCRQLFNERLGLRLTPSKVRRNVVEVVQRNDQWYVAMYVMKNVSLSQVEEALKGSEYTLERDKLRLFGHAYLIVQAPENSRDDLLADLKNVPNVSIPSAKELDDALQITIDMPYPSTADSNRESFDWVDYSWGDFSSDQSRRQRDPITADGLPRFRILQQVAKMHGGTLSDITWGMPWGCRTLGCVAEAK